MLYPPGLPPVRRLLAYTDAFAAVELNASFSRRPPVRTFAGWRDRLPDGFRMSVKAPRGLTHAKRLLEPEAWIDRITAGWWADRIREWEAAGHEVHGYFTPRRTA